MTEITNLKEYDISIEELLRRVVKVKAANISQAYDYVSDKINSGDILLTADDYSGDREIRNFNSKNLNDNLRMFVSYNPEDGIITIFHDNNREAKYVCDSAYDLKRCINTYIDNYIEEQEIEANKDLEIEEEIERG